MTTLQDFSIESLQDAGDVVAGLSGKVVLAVNVASAPVDKLVAWVSKRTGTEISANQFGLFNHSPLRAIDGLESSIERNADPGDGACGATENRWKPADYARTIELRDPRPDQLSPSVSGRHRCWTGKHDPDRIGRSLGRRLYGDLAA